MTCVVQVRGKVRDRLEVPADISEDALRELALASAKVQAAVPDGIRTVIVRAPKLVNVVPPDPRPQLSRPIPEPSPPHRFGSPRR